MRILLRHYSDSIHSFHILLGPIGVCDDFEEGSIIRRQIQSTVSTIPGIVVLPYSSSVSIGDNTKGISFDKLRLYFYLFIFVN